MLGVDLSVSFLLLFFHQKRHWKHYWRFYCIVLNLLFFNPGWLNVEFSVHSLMNVWSMTNQSILKNGLEYQKCLKIENCSNNRIRYSRVIAPNKSYYTFKNCIFSSNWFPNNGYVFQNAKTTNLLSCIKGYLYLYLFIRYLCR